MSARTSFGKQEPPYPIPRRTSLMSAPTSSHSRDIKFMKLIRIASIAFAAYFVSSAEAMSMNMTG